MRADWFSECVVEGLVIINRVSGSFVLLSHGMSVSDLKKKKKKSEEGRREGLHLQSECVSFSIQASVLYLPLLSAVGLYGYIWVSCI